MWLWTALSSGDVSRAHVKAFRNSSAEKKWNLCFWNSSDATEVPNFFAFFDLTEDRSTVFRAWGGSVGRQCEVSAMPITEIAGMHLLGMYRGVLVPQCKAYSWVLKNQIFPESCLHCWRVRQTPELNRGIDCSETMRTLTLHKCHYWKMHLLNFSKRGLSQPVSTLS